MLLHFKDKLDYEYYYEMVNHRRVDTCIGFVGVFLGNRCVRKMPLERPKHRFSTSFPAPFST